MQKFELSDMAREALFQRTVGSGHIKTYLVGKHLKQVIDNCIEEAAKIQQGFTGIAFTGMSGALVAPSVAAALNKQLIIVRKKDDKSRHGCDLVEGHRRKQKYIIIDDFVQTGSSVRRMIRDIRAHLNKENECIAIIEFARKLPQTIFEVDKYAR